MRRRTASARSGDLLRRGEQPARTLEDQLRPLGAAAVSAAAPAVAAVRDSAGPLVAQLRDDVGPLAAQVRDTVRPVVGRVREQAGPTLEQLWADAAPFVESVREQAGPALEQLATHAEAVGARVAHELPVAAALTSAAATQAAGSAEQAWDLSRHRGTAAWSALRGEPVTLSSRRWPWAIVAALGGAAAGAGVAYGMRSRAGSATADEEVVAVIDRPVSDTTTQAPAPGTTTNDPASDPVTVHTAADADGATADPDTRTD